MTLLEIAESGDLPELTRQLTNVVDGFGHNNSRGQKMTESEKLLDEALTYARLGDLDEATHRLRLRAKPKWGFVESCQASYDEAMGR